jgi:excisionase family DNA binding protein
MLELLPDVLTIDQVAKILQVSENAVRGMIKSSDLKAIKVGRCIRIPKKFLIEFLNTPMYNSNVQASPVI